VQVARKSIDQIMEIFGKVALILRPDLAPMLVLRLLRIIE
jgi:hypothetical protein